MLDRTMDQTVFRGFFSTLCGGDEEAQRTLLEWTEGMIVTPEVKPGKAIALFGSVGGEGKSAVVKVLIRMIHFIEGGAVWSTAEPQRDVWGRFNAVIENTLLVCIIETDWRFRDRLHAFISDSTIRVREKYQPQRTVASFHRVVLTTHIAMPDSFTRHVDQIRCYPPTGDAAAHFNAFYDMLEQATPDELRRAVVSYAAYLKRPRGWKALRMYWRARWIAVYWHALTEKHMAPGGKMAKRDRAAYEAD